jgi:hypothetical protein
MANVGARARRRRRRQPIFGHHPIASGLLLAGRAMAFAIFWRAGPLGRSARVDASSADLHVLRSLPDRDTRWRLRAQITAHAADLI